MKQLALGLFRISGLAGSAVCICLWCTEATVRHDSATNWHVEQTNNPFRRCIFLMRVLSRSFNTRRTTEHYTGHTVLSKVWTVFHFLFAFEGPRNKWFFSYKATRIVSRLHLLANILCSQYWWIRIFPICGCLESRILKYHWKFSSGSNCFVGESAFGHITCKMWSIWYGFNV